MTKKLDPEHSSEPGRCSLTYSRQDINDAIVKTFYQDVSDNPYEFKKFRKKTFVHPTAKIDKSVIISAGVIIGKHAVIKKNSILGQDTIIGDYAIVGENCKFTGAVAIGKQCNIGGKIDLNKSCLQQGSIIAGNDDKYPKPCNIIMANIGENSMLDNFSKIHNSITGNNCYIKESFINASQLGNYCKLINSLVLEQNIIKDHCFIKMTEILSNNSIGTGNEFDGEKFYFDKMIIKNGNRIGDNNTIIACEIKNKNTIGNNNILSMCRLANKTSIKDDNKEELCSYNNNKKSKIKNMKEFYKNNLSTQKEAMENEI